MSKSLSKTLLFFIILFIDTIACQAKEPQEIKELKSIFDKYNVSGSILVFDYNNNEYKGFNIERCNQGFSPASTFKIPNTLIALETETITTDSIFKWNGEKQDLPAWEADMNIAQAYKASCVPIYQGIAKSIGVEQMQKYVRLLHFGNMVINQSNINRFWLEQESKITQFQQIYFLKRLYNLELPISDQTMLTVKQIMLQEDTRDYKLSAKTGLDVSGDIIHGWFVGYIETQDNVYFFATNIEPIKEIESIKFSSSRIQLTKDVLAFLNAIPTN